MKTIKLDNKWLIMSPSVFVDMVNEHTILLYDTKNGHYLISHDNKLISLVTILYKPQNLGVVNAEILADYNSVDIDEALEKGFIYTKNMTNKYKPINFLPILNLQKDLEKEDENGIKGRLQIIGSKLRFVSGVYITLDYAVSNNDEKLFQLRNIAATQHPCPSYGNVNEKLSVDNVKYILENLKLTSTAIVDFICSSYYFENCSFRNFLELISKYGFSYRFHLYIEDYERLAQEWETVEDKPIVEFVIYNDRFSSHNVILQNKSLPYKIKQVTLIYDECDLQIGNENMLPVWTGDNMEFFKKNIWIEKSDIDNTVVNMHSIFRNKKLNANFFGIIDFIPNGNIYPHGVKHSIGNISDPKFSFSSVIVKELKDNNSWRLTRNLTHCSQCPYRYLCPPISIYEMQLKNIKMCNINKH